MQALTVHVIIVQDGKFTLLEDRFLVRVHQFVIIELRFFAISVNVTATWAGDFEELTDVFLPDEDKLLAVGIQALKALEHNVAHAFDMVWTYLVLLLDSRICLASCHENMQTDLQANQRCFGAHFESLETGFSGIVFSSTLASVVRRLRPTSSTGLILH